MAAEVDEVEDLTCCSICLDPYDVDIRKPKFLKCHHTFCLECIKVIVYKIFLTFQALQTSLYRLFPEAREL